MFIKPNVAVIGTIFVDYKGFAGKDYHAVGRNLGKIEIVAGGVGRNVAVNLTCLNAETYLVSAINSDGVGQGLKRELEHIGVHTDYITSVQSGGVGSWLAILNEKGELLGSISQMPDIPVFTQSVTPALIDIFSKTKHVVLETDLGLDLVNEVIASAEKADGQIYALPGNLSVIGQNLDLFKSISCFVCNDIEAKKIMGLSDIESPDKLLEEMQHFVEQYGLKSFVVTMGKDGALYVDEHGNSGYKPSIDTEVVDTTGAGDAFFSGVVAALVNGKTLGQAVDLGNRVASYVITVKGSDGLQCAENIQALLTG